MASFPPVQDILVVALPVILAITLHEAAHGYMALRCGDTTALRAGRISLNPLRHVDLIGTFLLPGALFFFGAPFLFGYAKPVPVNFGALTHPRRDMVLVALAGPGANIGLALLSALLSHALPFLPEAAAALMLRGIQISLMINSALAVFNMLPLPPLDGGRVAVGLLPNFLARPLARLEPWGLVILIIVFISVPYLANILGWDIHPFHWLLEKPIKGVLKAVLFLTGAS